MKLFNNDIKEIESAIFLGEYTDWNDKNIDLIVDKKVNYLKNKYNTNIKWLDKWRKKWIKYLNKLDENDIIELFEFTNNKYIEYFWKEYWNKAFSKFTGNLLEDWENYSKIINSSEIINKFLLEKYNEIIKSYKKNHKYEIWRYISIVYKNLDIKLANSESSDIYEFWEKYKS